MSFFEPRKIKRLEGEDNRGRKTSIKLGELWFSGEEEGRETDPNQWPGEHVTFGKQSLAAGTFG